MSDDLFPRLDMPETLQEEIAQEQDTTDVVGASSPELKSKKGSRKVFKVLGIVFVVLLVLVATVGGLGFYAFTQAKDMMQAARDLEAPSREAYAALKDQNLGETDKKLQETEEKLGILRAKYDKLSWTKFIPFAGAYYRDGEHAFNAGSAGLDAAKITVKAVEPYADVLGFTGKGTFTGGSIENRIKLLIATISKVTPVVDELTGKLDVVGKELAQIDERRYPESFRGKQIRSHIVEIKKLSAGASQAVVEAKPVLEVLPDIAGGAGKRKKYLIVFQNDNELRATGGFMTAFTKMFVEDGHASPDRSDDIYELDKKFKNKPDAPPILKKYLTTETKWNLRDMNLSPDFKNSMDVFWSYMSKLPGESKDIDGIIAIDTHVLVDLVRILGPVEVSGYGTFSADTDKRCNCPQIIYALSEIVDRPTPFLRANRKGIIGPMMQGVLAKAYAAPHQLWPQLFEAGWNNIQAKHVQFYFFDEKSQKAAEAIDAAGRVKPTPEGDDYLFIVDTNLGGAKSNLFVEHAVDQEISVPENGRIKKTLTLTYKNPFPPSNCNLEAGELCLNGKLTDWVRVYLPTGASVIESLGFDQDTTRQSDELDHSMYEGVFTLQPLNQAKVKITYTVPYDDTKEYRVFLQKQGGTDTVKYMMRVNGGEQEVALDKDQVVKIAF